jgi:peptide/nickel transport system permease protein
LHSSDIVSAVDVVTQDPSERLALDAQLGLPAARRHHHRLAWLPLGLVIAMAVFGPLVTKYDPEHADPLHSLLAPSRAHWFGTNNYGADVFSRVMSAGRLDLLIGFVSVALAFCVGCPLGAAVGYSRTWWSGVVMRLLEFVQSFPIFVLALGFVAITGASVTNVMLVIGVLNVPIFARLVRAEVLRLRDSNFVEAARCVGNSDLRLIMRHLLPNAIGPALAQASVQIGWALLVTAGLAFVGAGVQPPTPEWGLEISEGAEYVLTGQWWISVFPGLALGLAVWSFALAGDNLRDRYLQRRSTA